MTGENVLKAISIYAKQMNGINSAILALRLAGNHESAELLHEEMSRVSKVVAILHEATSHCDHAA